MAILFNELLESVNINPSDVRLLRHKDHRSKKGRDPYNLWCHERDQFDLYQSVQGFHQRANLCSKYWASFVGTPEGETMFVGVFEATYLGLLDKDTPKPQMDGIDKAGTVDKYELSLIDGLDKYIGKLYIEWGDGYRAWVQHADTKEKVITKIIE